MEACVADLVVTVQQRARFGFRGADAGLGERCFVAAVRVLSEPADDRLPLLIGQRLDVGGEHHRCARLCHSPNVCRSSHSHDPYANAAMPPANASECDNRSRFTTRLP